MTPFLASIAIFVGFVSFEGEEALTPAKVFTVISIFHLLATPMKKMMMTITELMNARASMVRINGYLDLGEKSPEGINADNEMFEKGEIRLDNCKFYWET